MMRSILWTVPLLGLSLSLCSAAQTQGIRTIALFNQHAPGTTGDVRFYGFGEPPLLNSDGQVMFRADLTGNGITYSGGVSDNAGIWTGDANSLSLIARAGDQASGLPAGVR